VVSCVLRLRFLFFCGALFVLLLDVCCDFTVEILARWRLGRRTFTTGA